MTTATRTVAVNDIGRRVGDSHHNAKLANGDVELLLALHHVDGWGYRRLAAKFEISKSHARYLVKGRWRGQVATSWRRVPVRLVIEFNQRHSCGHEQLKPYT